MKLFTSLAVGAALLLSVAALPAKAQDQNESVKAELQKIYEGINGLYAKAEAGNSRAAFFVSALHLNGIFVPFDAAKGHQFLEAAAAKGDAEAMYYLGLSHYHGMYDYKVDKTKAADLIDKAAKAGHAPAKQAQTIMNMTKK
jgi:TPR repeat protein